MSGRLKENPSEEQLTLFVEDSRARTFPLPENAQALLVSGPAYTTTLQELLMNLVRNGLLAKMSPVYSPPMEDLTSQSFWEGLPESFRQSLILGGGTLDSRGDPDIRSLGGCLTLSISEWPSDAAVCSLSEVLQPDVPRKYYLSPRACSGILRRAEKRGKELPPMLRQVLEAVALAPTASESKPAKTP